MKRVFALTAKNYQSHGMKMYHTHDESYFDNIFIAKDDEEAKNIAKMLYSRRYEDETTDELNDRINDLTIQNVGEVVNVADGISDLTRNLKKELLNIANEYKDPWDDNDYAQDNEQ